MAMFSLPYGEGIEDRTVHVRMNKCELIWINGCGSKEKREGVLMNYEYSSRVDESALTRGCLWTGKDPLGMF
jgi:hypothetical protein